MIRNPHFTLPALGRHMMGKKFSRVKFRQDRFVRHTNANRFIDEMNFVYELSGQNRRPVNLAIIGDGGTGKTSLIQHFLKSMMKTKPEYSSFGFKQNISSFDLPPRVTRRKLLNCILSPKYPGSGNVQLGRFGSQVEEQGLKLIIIDEFSELDRTHKNYRQEVLHTMKWIGNNLKIPFIVSGTSCINHVFKSDPQMGRRFKVMKMTDWEPGREFEYFVYSYLKSLPGFSEINSLPRELFDSLLQKGARTTFDVTTKLGDAAFNAYSNSDVENLHIYVQKLTGKSGYVTGT